MAFLNFYSEPLAAGTGNGVPQGLFIPVANLPGLQASELADNSEITKEGKAIYGLLNSIYSALAPIPSLGIVNLSKSSPSGTGTNRFTESVSFGFQWLLDLAAKQFYPIPLPTIGTEASKGKVSLSTIWPNCAKVEAEEAITEAGILIPALSVAEFGGSFPALVTDDARDWIAGLMCLMISGATLRTATVASAITAKTNLLTTRGQGFQVPAAWYDAQNPVTGILAVDVPAYRVFQDSLSIEYELEADPVTQTVEVRIATS